MQRAWLDKFHWPHSAFDVSPLKDTYTHLTDPFASVTKEHTLLARVPRLRHARLCAHNPWHPGTTLIAPRPIMPWRATPLPPADSRLLPRGPSCGSAPPRAPCTPPSTSTSAGTCLGRPGWSRRSTRYAAAPQRWRGSSPARAGECQLHREKWAKGTTSLCHQLPPQLY